jgi:hypothetical protein
MVRYQARWRRLLAAIAGILLVSGSVSVVSSQEPATQPALRPIPQSNGQQASQPIGQRRQMDPNRFSGSYGYPGTGVDPLPLPGPRPYWGHAIGATYYNWGFFGAHRHSQYINHTGYYGEYTQYGYSRNY